MAKKPIVSDSPADTDTNVDGEATASTETANSQVDTPDANPTDSSTVAADVAGGQDDKPEDKESLLSVLRAAVDKSSEESSSSDTESDSEKSKGNEEEAEASADAGAEKPEDFSDVPFHKHPRFRELKGQRDEATIWRTQHEPMVQEHQAIKDYMSKNDLSVSEVSDLLRIGALLKNDPYRAREEIIAIVTDLDGTLGYALPDDLREKVEIGEMTEEAAVELSVARSRSALSDGARQAQSNKAAQAEQARSLEALAVEIETEVNSWKTRTLKTDADYATKEPFIVDRFKALVVNAGGRLSSKEQALSLIQQAYNDVSARTSGFQPKPKAKTVVSAEDSGSGSVGAKPSSLREAIELGAKGKYPYAA
jgi:hypothetical protein